MGFCEDPEVGICYFDGNVQGHTEERLKKPLSEYKFKHPMDDYYTYQNCAQASWEGSW